MKHCQDIIETHCWLCDGTGYIKPEGETKKERLYNLKCSTEIYRELTRNDIKEIVIKNTEVECPECDGKGYCNIIHDYAVPECY